MREWADGAVVYSHHYGQTHALDLLTSVVLRSLSVEPSASPQALLTILEGHFPDLASQTLLQDIELARATLARHHLV